ncbi:MAG TPA: YicC family protein [Bacteroidales bacterium]|nr:YicC family protein [Bacteroidales bacterium]
MIRSMTGFGRAETTWGRRKVALEIKALNSKQLDLVLRLPNEFRTVEFDLRNMLAERLQRGKIDLTVNVESNGVNGQMIQTEAAREAWRQLEQLSFELGKPLPQDVFSLLVRFPGFFASSEPEAVDAFIGPLRDALAEATDALDQFRQREGQVLRADLLSHLYQIVDLLDQTEPFESQRIEQVKQRLSKNLAEFASQQKFDQNRFEQELIYYLEKLDIAEEKVRLRQHCSYFAETIDEDYAGKKLAFIAQEMGREINTMGSKANDASIQRLVVQMKDELEKIKEQLFNVL